MLLNIGYDRVDGQLNNATRENWQLCWNSLTALRILWLIFILSTEPNPYTSFLPAVPHISLDMLPTRWT